MIDIYECYLARTGELAFHVFDINRGNILILDTSDSHLVWESSESFGLGESRAYQDLKVATLELPIDQSIYDHYSMVYGAKFSEALKNAEEKARSS